MSRKKKGLALWLALFLGVSSLTGCGSGNDNMTQLSQKGADIMNSSDEEQDTDVELLKTKTQLPEDGIITQAQMETIAGKKIEYARQLLDEGNLKVFEVAQRVGFEDTTYFSHVFKKYTGMSAKEYLTQAQRRKRAAAEKTT